MKEHNLHYRGREIITPNDGFVGDLRRAEARIKELEATITWAILHGIPQLIRMGGWQEFETDLRYRAKL